ncbi:MAG: hypothetical protein WBO46_13660, partial [Caldilineaceae bacterium]
MLEQSFIDWAKSILKTNIVATREKHGDQSKVFRLDASSKQYFLKVGMKLEKERVRLNWLQKRVPVPEVLGFVTINKQDALLLSAIEGRNLAAMSKE